MQSPQRVLLLVLLASHAATCLQFPTGGRTWVRTGMSEWQPQLGGPRHAARSLVIREAWYVKKSFYDELGIERSASEDEIRSAYRRAAMECQ